MQNKLDIFSLAAWAGKYLLLAFPADIGRKPASPARAPWEPTTLKRRREPALPVTRHAG